MRALFFPVILVALAGAIGAMTATAPSAGAARQAVPCATVAVLASRGSGDTLGQDKGLSAPGQQFATHLAQLLGGAATPWANPYPAVGVFSWPWQHMSQVVNGLGAATKLSGLGLGAYHDSVVNGETKLASEIKLLESSSCATTPLVLVGYSQGAQVTADVYQRDLTDAQRQMVAAIVLFGDPYFNATNKTVDRGSYSGRRNGLLGTRPTFPTNERTLILSYCHSHDPICQGFYYRLGGTNISFDPATIPPHQHTNYTNFNEPEQAAQQVATRLKLAVPVPNGERFCGEAGGLDVYATATSVTCGQATQAAAAMLRLPPDGNSPGSPSGWSCYRLTGGPWGAACDRKGSHASIRVLGALDGGSGLGAPQSGACTATGTSWDNNALFLASVSLESVVGLNCSYVANLLFDWHANKMPGVGPVRFTCMKILGDSKRRCASAATSFIFDLLA